MMRTREMPPAEALKNIDELLLAVGPATGQLMNTLIKESKAQTILEIGTLHGYCTVWLAEAARATGGKVITLDVHAGKQEYARKELSKAGLASLVEFKLGDARESIASLQPSIDFVLLDLWKDLYITCFDLFYPKLSLRRDDRGGQFSRKEAEEYRKHVRAKPDLQSMLLPVGSGIEVSRCTRGLEFK
ncbi:MAG TPA: class I SAM-dependent methyltransferase [Candidatus Binataceae bacterium]|nr:class I SAM-dependent methyltransferase [Candidatus Binataceae bacterium]